MEVAGTAGGGAGVVAVDTSIAGVVVGEDAEVEFCPGGAHSQLKLQPEPVAGAMWW